jgi:hypothetical protein
VFAEFHVTLLVVQTPPGWYRDPTNPAFERWWDGESWSQSVRAASVVLTPRMGAVWNPSPPSTSAAAPLSAGASRTRTIAAVMGVILVLIALIVTLAVVRNGGPGDEWSDLALGDPAPVPATGTDFVESNGAYSIRVGDQWDPATFAAGAAWYTGTGDREFRDNVVIIVEDLPVHLSLGQYVDAGMHSADLHGVHFDEQSRTPIVLSDGSSALVIDSFSEQQGFDLGHRLVVAVHDLVAVTVTFTSRRDSFDQSVAGVDPFLRTLSVR